MNTRLFVWYFLLWACVHGVGLEGVVFIPLGLGMFVAQEKGDVVFSTLLIFAP